MTTAAKLRKLRHFIAHVEEELAQIERSEPPRAELTKKLAQLRIESIYALEEADK